MSFHQDFQHRSVLTSSAKVVPKVNTVFRTPTITKRTPAFTSTDNTGINDLSIFTGQGPRNIPPSSTDLGWTIFTATAPSGEGSNFAGAGTRIIYVANAGSDSNLGTLASPVATVAHGMTLLRLRAGKPDWLLLKKGDTWTNENMDLTGIHGASGSGYATTFSGQPALISSYPTTPGPRPILQYNGAGFATGTLNTHGQNGTDGAYLAIVGLEFYAYTRDPNNGSFSTTDRDLSSAPLMGLLNPVPWLLFEDCKWSYGTENTVVDGEATSPNVNFGTVIFNRCVIAFAYNTNAGAAHSGQGSYNEYINDLTINECVYDNNGWNSGITGAVANTFRHNLYIGADTPWNQTIQPITAVRGNIIARASCNGLQCRPGGLVDKNFFLNNAIAWFTATPPGQANTASQNTFNVATSLKDIDGSTPRGWGGQINGGNSSSMNNNIVAHQLSTSPASAFGIDISANNCDCENNIVYDLGSTVSGVYLTNNGTGNTLANNITLSSGGGFLDPTRDAASYNASLGGAASIDAFMTECRKQSKDNWRTQYTAKAVINYIRAGFNLGAI